MSVNVGLPGLLVVLLLAGGSFGLLGMVATEVAKPVPFPGAGVPKIIAALG